MSYGKRWPMGVCVVGVMVAVFCAGAQTISRVSSKETSLAEPKKADVIHIDTLRVFGPLERPVVEFHHEKHELALEKEKKDCKACHMSAENYKMISGTQVDALAGIDPLSPRFRRLKETARKDVMEIYHAECIGCHKSMMDEGVKTGPVTCGECHKGKVTPVSREKMGFDKSLHYRHSRNYPEKCGTCHHEYDELKGKLFYRKGKEESCRHCHREVTEKNRMSMREASHLSCIGCHRKRDAENLTAGPSKCSGCHDPLMRKEIETVEKVPRMERKQPNTVLLTGGKAGTRMDAVPFDHKAHEEYNDTCRACHHESMAPCRSCHEIGASPQGMGISLERAMHRTDGSASCKGCHGIAQNEKKCAGCHMYPGKREKIDMADCAACHKMPVPADMEKISGEELKARAGALLRNRTAVTDTYADEVIPEKVEIKDMMDKYGPVEFPHRKIVRTLTKGIEDSRLARYFHSSPGTVCQGCHHNSPVSEKPPRCGSCHGEAFKGDVHRPGKMGAYHIQCMGCHREMDIKKPAECNDCHKLRESVVVRNG